MKECRQTHPYTGRRASLATKHGKERQIARPLHAALNLDTYVPPTIDTDLLGTFTGEIPRRGSPAQVVLQKARMGMEMTGLSLGLANEGSFGPHPAFPLVTADTELLVFVDDERGIHVQESVVSEQVVAAQAVTHSIADLAPFLAHALFPSHALIVRPNALLQSDLLFKGITDPVVLEEKVKLIAAISPDGLALVETDLRAHMNPTRRRVLRHLAVRLARRLAHLCPACRTPGWGLVSHLYGLPCEWCGEATDLVCEDLFGCPACSYRQHHPRSDGLLHASPTHCPSCNP